MKKNKIMFFVSGLTSGGAEQMIMNYCKYMNNEIFEFILVYQHEPEEICINKVKKLGIKTERVTARCDGVIKNIIDTYKIIRKYQPDIVHSNMNLMNFCASIPAKLCGVKIRISHSHIAEKNKNILYRIMASICKFAIIKSNNVYYACGKEAGKYLYGKHKFLEINNAIDFYQFDPDGDDFRKELKLENKIVIGNVGRFTEQKNHIRLLKIFKKVVEQKSNAVLLLVGTGELEYNIKKAIEEMKLTDNVIFMGNIAQMYKFYNTLDVFLLPSLYEGFPIVGLEVQAACVPSILSDRIDENIVITDCIKLYSLDKNDDEWSKLVIEKILEKRMTKDIAWKKLENAGYNIRLEAKKLENMYLKYISDY